MNRKKAIIFLLLFLFFNVLFLYAGTGLEFINTQFNNSTQTNQSIQYQKKFSSNTPYKTTYISNKEKNSYNKINQNLDDFIKNQYPRLIEYSGQTIYLSIPFSLPIVIEMPDVIDSITAEKAITGLQILPKRRAVTNILKILLQKNINFNTAIHVRLADGNIITFVLKLRRIRKASELLNYDTRFKVLYKSSLVNQNTSKYDDIKYFKKPELINFYVDKIAFNQLFALAGLSEVATGVNVSDVDYKLLEDNKRKIIIKKYTVTNTQLVIKTNFRQRDVKIPVSLFGLKVFFCNKLRKEFLTLNINDIKKIFPSFYLISYNRNSDSLIEPLTCVPAYIILWKGIRY